MDQLVQSRMFSLSSLSCVFNDTMLADHFEQVCLFHSVYSSEKFLDAAVVPKVLFFAALLCLESAWVAHVSPQDM